MAAPGCVPRNVLLEGDCLPILRTLPDACVDALVTDPPHGLKWKPAAPSAGRASSVLGGGPGPTDGQALDRWGPVLAARAERRNSTAVLLAGYTAPMSAVVGEEGRPVGIVELPGSSWPPERQPHGWTR